MLIAMLTLKPHIGVLFPIALIASSRWRVLIAAAVTTIVIAACTAALFGLQSWVAFVNQSDVRAGSINAFRLARSKERGRNRSD